jgi:hypothetical protein
MKWGYKKYLIISTLILLVGSLGLFSIDSLRTYWVEFANPFENFNLVIPWSKFYGYNFWLPQNIFLKLIFQIGIIVISVLGLFIIFLPAFLIKKKNINLFDSFPLLILANFIFLMLFAPIASNGDWTEYRHRHFPLIYIIFAIFTFAYCVEFAGLKFGRRLISWGSIIFVSIIGLFSLLFNFKSNLSVPNIQLMPWSANFHNRKVIPGTGNLAFFLKNNSNKGEFFLMGSDNISGIFNPGLVVISISDVPSYLTRPELWGVMNSNIVGSRREVLKKIENSTDWMEARDIMKENNIRWFISYAEDDIAWPKVSRDFVFENNEFKVFDSQK